MVLGQPAPDIRHNMTPITNIPRFPHIYLSKWEVFCVCQMSILEEIDDSDEIILAFILSTLAALNRLYKYG